MFPRSFSTISASPMREGAWRCSTRSLDLATPWQPYVAIHELAAAVAAAVLGRQERWRYLPLTRTPRKRLTWSFATPWRSPALCVPRDRARSAAFLATTHNLSLRASSASYTRPVSAGLHPLDKLQRQRRPRRIHKPLMPGVPRTHSGMGVRFDKATNMPHRLPHASSDPRVSRSVVDVCSLNRDHGRCCVSVGGFPEVFRGAG